MAEATYELTRSELVAYAAQRGYAVTADQVVRWHKAGLLPRPKRRALGRGHGTVSRYPPTARELVVEVACELDLKRSLDQAIWRRWADGRWVEEKAVRRLLERVLRRLEGAEQVVRDAQRDDDLGDALAGRLATWSGRRGRTAAEQDLHRLMRREGREAMTALSVRTGTGDPNFGPDHVGYLLKIVRAVLPLGAGDSVTTEQVASVLPIVAAVMQPSALRAAYEHTDLEEARDARRALIGGLGVLAILAIPGGLSPIIAPAKLPLEKQLHGFLLWLTARQHTAWRDGIDWLCAFGRQLLEPKSEESQ